MATLAEIRALEAKMRAAVDAYTAAVNTTLEVPAPTPPEPAPVRPRFGLYPGADPKQWQSKVASFVADTGIQVVQVGGNQDQQYDGARGSVAGVAASAVPVPTLTIAIQLGFTGGPYGDTQGKVTEAAKRRALQATVDGKNDAIYVANAAALKASTYQRIVVRLGSEGDIGWPPHSYSPGNDDVYRVAWRRVRAIFAEALGPRVRFSYTTTMFAADQNMLCHDGQVRNEMVAGYPGGDAVDIVGIDCYLGKPLREVQRLVGLGLRQAAIWKKPVAFDEWGINAEGHTLPPDDQCAFMSWVEGLPLEYASFFGGWAGSTYPADYSAIAQRCLKDAWR